MSAPNFYLRELDKYYVIFDEAFEALQGSVRVYTKAMSDEIANAMDKIQPPRKLLQSRASVIEEEFSDFERHYHACSWHKVIKTSFVEVGVPLLRKVFHDDDVREALKHGSNIFALQVDVTPVIRNGYYGGAILDILRPSSRLENGGLEYPFDSVDIADEILNFPCEHDYDDDALYALAERVASWLNTLTEMLFDAAYDAANRKAGEMADKVLELTGVASNGEAFYKEVK